MSCIFVFFQSAVVQLISYANVGRAVVSLPGPCLLCLEENGYSRFVESGQKHEIDDTPNAVIHFGAKVQDETRRIRHIPIIQRVNVAVYVHRHV